MLLRTVVAGYLGATLVVAGTGVSAYKLLQARHAPVETHAVVQPYAGPLAVLSGPLTEAPPEQAGSFPIALPELRPPTSVGGEHHVSVARPRLAHSRVPIGVSLREPARRPVRTVIAAEQASRSRPHPTSHPVGYPYFTSLR